jgi:hypothetical protein
MEDIKGSVSAAWWLNSLRRRYGLPACEAWFGGLTAPSREWSATENQ